MTSGRQGRKIHRLYGRDELLRRNSNCRINHIEAINRWLKARLPVVGRLSISGPGLFATRHVAWFR